MDAFLNVSNIQRFSVDDGPGIRTTVFLKGCNLRCLWCHNPESLSSAPSLQYIKNNCLRCGACAEICPHGAHTIDEKGHHINWQACTACGACEKVCRAKALYLVGKPYTVAELLTILLKDQAYYRTSDGGVTFSGGEPMLQYAALTEMLKACKEAGLSTAVDTAGNVPWEHFAAVLPYTDLFLYDVKLFDTQKHRQATGVPNERILENLRRLSDASARIIIRTPIIREINGDLVEIEKIKSFLSTIAKVELIQLLPYHSYGAGKYETLGYCNQIKDHTPPAEEFMQQALHLFTKNGLNATIS